MAFTQADIDTLKAALARGVKRVAYKDQTVEYQSRAEMAKTLRDMEAEVGGKISRRPRVRLAQPRSS